MTRFPKIILICIPLFCILSCNEHHSNKKTIEKLLSSQITFPAKWNTNIHDDVSYLNAAAKMVVLFDSTTCASCELAHLWEWDEVSSISDETQNKFTTVFIFSPGKKDIISVKRSLENIQSNKIRAIIDEDQEFIRLNPFIPKENTFHTFLLDSENNILLVGNPVKNDKLWNLYKSTIKTTIDNY